jgi:hypothetical protein
MSGIIPPCVCHKVRLSSALSSSGLSTTLTLLEFHARIASDNQFAGRRDSDRNRLYVTAEIAFSPSGILSFGNPAAAGGG